MTGGTGQGETGVSVLILRRDVGMPDIFSRGPKVSVGRSSLFGYGPISNRLPIYLFKLKINKYVGDVYALADYQSNPHYL